MTADELNQWEERCIADACAQQPWWHRLIMKLVVLAGEVKPQEWRSW